MNNFLEQSFSPEDPNALKDAEGLYDVQIQGKKQLYICKIADCGRNFRYRSEIIRHVATHTNHRPHVCPFDVCKKSFKRADALENHVRTHTKETPFICSFQDCGMQFTTKASLRYHVLKHKNQRVHACGYPGCTKSFITIFQLKQHEKSACIHKKIKVRDGPEANYSEITDATSMATQKNINHDHDKDDVTPPNMKRSKVMDWDVTAQMQTQIPIQPAMQQMNQMPQMAQMPQMQQMQQNYPDQQDPFGHKVRNILTENQILKKRLEFSQKIITLLQQKNEPMPYMEQTGDVMQDNNAFFAFRPSLFQGQMYE